MSFRGLLAAVVLVVGLLVAEIALRLLDLPTPTRSGWRAQLSASEQNQLGFRGQPILYGETDFVIVLVGDSFSEAQSCAYERMPERRLEHYLNASGKRVRVFSVGANGYGQDQELLGLRAYFARFRANLVLLWETPINDIWNNVFPTAFGVPKPTFWLEHGELRGPSEQVGQPLGETSTVRLAELWSRAFAPARDQRWETRLPPPYRAMTEFTGPIKDDWQQLWDRSAGFRLQDVDREKSPLAISLTPRSARMQYGLDLTRKLMQELRSLAAAHSAQFAVFAPDIFLDDLRGDGVRRLNGRYYRTSAHQYKDNLEYLNRGFLFYLIEVTVAQWRMGPENIHLNEHATDQVMEDLAKRVRHLIPDPRRG